MHKGENPSSLKNPYLYFVAYSLCFISLGLAGVSLGPLLPMLSQSTGTSLSQISFIFSTRSLGYLLGAIGGGYLYDRVNGHKLMVFCLSIMVVGQFLIPLFPTYFFILIAMFMIGLGHAVIDIGVNVNLLWIYQSKVGPYMNALHFCFGVGALLSPLLVHYVMRITDSGLKWPFWSLAFIFLPGIFSLLILAAPQNPEKDLSPANLKIGNQRLIILLMLLFLLYVAIEGGFGGWIYTYVTRRNLANETAAAFINSVFWGALTFGRLISIPLAKKITPSKLLISNFVFAILSLAMILLWPKNNMIIWAASIGFGLSLSSAFPTLMVLSETRLKITGRITSLFFVGASLGGLLMPMLLGQIFDYIGSFYIMIALFVTTFLGLIVLLSVLLVAKRLGEKQRNYPKQ